MRPALFAALLFLIQLSAAACTSQAKLNDSANACLQGGQDAVYFLDGACMTVACGPKSRDVVGVCLQADALSKGIQNCLGSGYEADVFGNMTCADIKCSPRSGSRGSQGPGNLTNSSSLLDAATYYGTKYSTVIGAVGTVLVAIGGWYLATRKKSKMSLYLTRIDEMFSSYKENAIECEAELKKMKKSIVEELKKGNLDESTFGIVDKRIDDCLAEVREAAREARKEQKKA